MSRVAHALALALALTACEKPSGTRAIVLRGVPRCLRDVAYARPIVIRLDRDRAVFEDPYTTQLMLEMPPTLDAATLTIARQRMRATLRVGACVKTSLGTWDCAAPTWISTTTLALDQRDVPVEVTLPKTVVECADGASSTQQKQQ